MIYRSRALIAQAAETARMVRDSGRLRPEPKVEVMNKNNAALLPVILAGLFLAAGCASRSTAGQPRTLPDGSDPESQFKKAEVALDYGLPDEAIRYGQAAVAAAPNHFKAWMLLGSAYFRKNDSASSAAAYEKAVAIDPGSAEAHRCLGVVLLDMRDRTRAEAELRKAVELNGDPDAVLQLGRILHEDGRNDEALQWAETAIKKNAKNPAAYNLKGVVLNQLQRWDEAIEALKTGLGMRPDDVGMLINLGIAYLNDREIAKGREALEKALPRINDPNLKAKIQAYLDSIGK